MSLPPLPPIPPTPPIVVPQPPTKPPPSTNAGDLDIGQNNQNKANSNSTALVENTNVNVNSQTAPNVQVGDIAYQGPHWYFNAYYNQNDYGVVTGIQIPLGGAKVRKAAASLAQVKVANARLSTCAAVSSMSKEAVEAIAQEFAVCAERKRYEPMAPERVKPEPEARTAADIELAQLRAEIAALRASMAKPVAQPAVPGLW